MVLKIEKASRNSEHEYKLLCWLDGKLPVPKIIEAEIKDGVSFLLLSKMPGDMVFTGENLKDMDGTVKALAKGLKSIWSLDISDCPCRFAISDKLLEAKTSIENGLVDTNDFDPETIDGGFPDPDDLYIYLSENRPKEDFVFTHGDYSFPNIFVSGGEVTGMIDWGYGGIADRWQDISVCYRALRKKYSKHGLYCEKDYLRYKSIFFGELGIEPDEEKVRYYNYLNEIL